ASRANVNVIMVDRKGRRPRCSLQMSRDRAALKASISRYPHRIVRVACQNQLARAHDLKSGSRAEPAIRFIRGEIGKKLTLFSFIGILINGVSSNRKIR